MMGSKRLAALAAASLLFCVPLGSTALGESGAPAADVVGSASSPSHKSPLHVKIVDYQKAEEGPGTLKMSGTGLPGSNVHISVDGKPFAKVLASDKDGAWSVEDQIPLDESVHAVRVQQFDAATNLPAATAMFSMSLAPPTPEQLAAPPAGR
ncbi:MAG: hypothetical protein AAF405_02110 [Pseudomonadota bacterium]